MPAHTLALARAGIGTPDWLETNGVRIAVVIAVAIALSRLGTLAIRRMRRRLEGSASVTGSVNLRRTATVVELVASTVRIVIWTVVALLVLGELGLDLGPLIAGAGIIGVALAFGAQSLVRDFLSGFFILTENQFTVGDSVEIVCDVAAASVSGRVEAMTLRTTAVRSEEGALAVVPNGHIVFMTNRSRGRARVMVEVHVPRGEDLQEVRRLLEALCDEIRLDERMAGRLFSGPEVLGIDRLQTDTVLMRVVAETSPARADEVKQELSRRIEQRFVPVPHEVDIG
jgi:small conductance mechanosensitive channel